MKTPAIRFSVLSTLSGLLLALCMTVPVQAAAPGVSVQREGSNVVVNFTGRLQSSSRAEGPFTTVGGARSPHLTPLSDAPQQFWRTVLNDVRAIAAGDGQTLAVRRDGTLWAWGSNQYGQLGIGNTNYADEPVQVGTNTNWRTVSLGAGACHSLALRDDGTLWAWGDNRFGQLGIGTTSVAYEPVQVGTNADWESVSAGWIQTLALRTEGTLWAWGDNRFGQLGIGSTNVASEPQQVGTNNDWKAIAASRGYPIYPAIESDFLRFSHNLGIREDGTLWAWGNNQHGQLGVGTFATNAPYGATQPTRVGTNTGWQAVSAGGYHTVAIRDDGTVWVWGSDDQGQLGLQWPSSVSIHRTNEPVQLLPDPNWRAVSAGVLHSMAIRNDGTLWAWGDDRGSQLGIDTSITEYGSRYPTARGPLPWPVDGNATWQAVAAGVVHTVALRDDGSVWTWGSKGLGRTPVGSSSLAQIGTDTNWLTVDAGCDYSIALRNDGTLWAWGWNEFGLLGLGTFGDRNQPTQIGFDANWQQVDAGNSHIVAIRTDGTLWTWGRGRDGPAQVGTDTNWIAASASGDSTEVYYDGRHVVALRRDGTLWTWGDNDYGQLGIGEAGGPREVATVTQIGTNADWRAVSAGWFHTTGIRQDGTLWAWGLSGPGALGLGEIITTTNRPAQVGTNSDWVAVYAGRFLTKALRADGTLWMWGNTSTNGSVTMTYEPVQVGTETDWRHVPTDDNHFYRDGADPAWPWRSIASGWRHFVGIRHDGTLWASGDNRAGQIAQPTWWAPGPIAGKDWGLPGD